MNTEQIKKFKEVLETEQQHLQSALSSIGVKNPDNGEWEATSDMSDGPEADENDLADRSEDFEERSVMLSTLATRLAEVDNALEKMKNNTYGICDVCKGKIETERLMANPAAATCVEHIGE